MKQLDIKTKHGHLFTCNKCNKFHFEFNQMAIDFSSLKIVENFYSYLKTIDGNEFERINRNTQYHRKIQIPFPNTTIKLVLSQTDLSEIKTLIENFISKYKKSEFENQMIQKLSQVSVKQLN